MRTILLRMLALSVSVVFTIAGCSDGNDNEPMSMSDALAKMEKARLDSQAPRPPIPEATDVPESGLFVVKVESSAGDYTIEVHRDWAPIGADRFYKLVKAGFYDECRYFRVVPGFMVQFGISGDPALNEEWDQNIRDDDVRKSNARGFVTFAKSGFPHTRTTQVFINFGDNSRLDPDGFAPFGQVIEGMENVDRINSKYGESPEQGSIATSGNAYLKQSFPDLDFIRKMTVVSESPE